MVSANFLLRSQYSVKELLLNSESRGYFRYLRGLVGIKNIVAGVLLLAENKVLEGELATAANYPRKQKTIRMLADDMLVDPFNPIHLNVENNLADIVTASGHGDRFLFSLVDRPICITRKFKGIRLPDYSMQDKEFVTAILNSLIVKSLWLVSSARTYAVLTAHHVSIVRREFISIDWNRIPETHVNDILRLFRLAYPSEFVVPKVFDEFRSPAVREFNLCILDAIKCEARVYDDMVKDMDSWFVRPNHSTDLKLKMKL